ncbi:hypothetical protein ERJ75_001362700 [Trypanosoma vivax]|nr:hypothetical protein ERJ75_001362700 [Trypanosoma vivax]
MSQSNRPSTNPARGLNGVIEALDELKATMARDLESVRQQWSAVVGPRQHCALSDFMRDDQEVPIPQGISELRRQQRALLSE